MFSDETIRISKYHLAIVHQYTHETGILLHKSDAQFLARCEAESDLRVSVSLLRLCCQVTDVKTGGTYTSLSAWLPVGAAMYLTPWQ